MSCTSCSPPAIRPPVDLNNQSEIIRGREVVRVSKFFSGASEGKFLSTLYDDVKTLYDAFRKGAKESNNGRCLGWRQNISRPYQWIHYNQALLRARNFGSGLLGLGVNPGSFVGIYSQNCPEWIITEQGAYCYSMIIVALYDTLGPDACAFIINQAEISVLIVDDDSKCNQIIDRAPRCLKKIISIKEVRMATMQRARSRAIEIIRFDEIERVGAQKMFEEVPPKPTDLCTICYTSGTTGNPKGVMLTHGNVIAAISAALLQLSDHRPKYSDVLISFLPLAHMLERTCESAMFLVGGSIGYYSGDIKNLTEDMKTLKPTIMPAVPRLLNRMYDKVMAQIRPSFIKRLMFNMAMGSKENEIKKGIYRRNSIWDKLVFKKVQEDMGGNLRLMLAGSAPLAGNVLTFLRCALGCLVIEGYGQTECVAPITLTIQGDYVPEHVGPPICCCSVKLVDVPEMDYFAHEGKGEVCVRGNNVFLGYFKDPELNSIDELGWHHTGDVGMWLPSGALKIIDRKRHIFKLAQGEYIVPEKIEAVYSKSLYVHQIFVYGESLKSYIVAIVVPDVDVVKCKALENGIPGTLSVLCADPKVKQMIMEDMAAWARQDGLRNFEQVKDIYLHPDPFSVQNGLLTPNFKMQRAQLKSYFKPQIEDLYNPPNPTATKNS
ncbi:hypothetical protein M8J77_014875 [Diaphorina citri]|nr:hypothetical protein M8J77_014875 [Diaphorina citri]